MTRLRVILLLVLALLLPIQAFARPAAEESRIQYLITSIAGLQDAVFVRNGRSYNAVQAAEHLRQKLDYAGNKVQTAEDFIRLCATGSWMSGKRYTIRMGDGRVVGSADFLRAQLRVYDTRPAKPAARPSPPKRAGAA